MTTWILVVYFSVGVGSFATGGPISVDGFTSQSKCEAAGQKLKAARYGDWYACHQVEK